MYAPAQFSLIPRRHRVGMKCPDIVNDPFERVAAEKARATNGFSCDFNGLFDVVCCDGLARENIGSQIEAVRRYPSSFLEAKYSFTNWCISDFGEFQRQQPQSSIARSLTGSNSKRVNCSCREA